MGAAFRRIVGKTGSWEMKAKALATCEIHATVPPKHWKDDVALMQFLRSF
jgi:hypothetical protein